VSNTQHPRKWREGVCVDEDTSCALSYPTLTLAKCMDVDRLSHAASCLEACSSDHAVVMCGGTACAANLTAPRPWCCVSLGLFL
jgi:hypothetical protein